MGNRKRISHFVSERVISLTRNSARNTLETQDVPIFFTRLSRQVSDFPEIAYRYRGGFPIVRN